MTEARHAAAASNKSESKPIFVSTLAATCTNKLKLMLNQESEFIRTKIDCLLLRKYLEETKNNPPD